MVYRVSDFTREYQADEKLRRQAKKDGLIELALDYNERSSYYIGAAREWFQQQSPATQAKFELGYAPNGNPLLSDPETIRRMALEAVGPIPTSPQEIEHEIRVLRYSLRRNRKSWFGSPSRQLRLMVLLDSLKRAPAAQRESGQPTTSYPDPHAR